MIEQAFRSECARCGRPEVGCYCDAVTTLETRTRIVILQHPREHDKAINTARIAALALPSVSLFVGIDFSDSRALDAALADPERPPVLLFPGPDARDLAQDPPPGPVTLVVVDGTWHQARALVRKNPRLATLPRYAFQPAAPSEYRIRREPRADYVSTIEAIASVLPLLEGEARFAPLLSPFRAMVDFQLSHAARSTGARKRTRRRNGNEARARLPEALATAELVCVTGEANAWPHDRSVGRPPYPHELVHWLAVRAGSYSAGERFEMVLAPRAPCASSPIVHARLTEQALAAGLPVAALLEEFAAFARPADVFCTWGHYGADLYARESGVALGPQIDIRKVAGDFLKRRPGSIESLVEERGLAFEPLGAGRGGERLGMLHAVTRWLVDEARREHSPRTADVRAID